MNSAVNKIMFVFIFILTVSCGAASSSSKNGIYNSTLLERQCRKSTTSDEPVTLELATLYKKFLKESPLSYVYIPEKLYDYKTPLVINLKDIKTKVGNIKAQIADESYLRDHYTEIALDVYYLYQSALRYEGAKCQLKNLSAKKLQDITPYMSMKDFCTDKSNSEICSVETLLNLSTEDALFVQEKTVQMCGLLTGNSESCLKQYSLETAGVTQTKFRDEKYNKLFTLKDSHLKFRCDNGLNITTMHVKVFGPGLDADKLKALTAYVSHAWTNNKFQLSMEIVDTKTADVIEIIPTNKAVSYVMDNDNHQVYLSQVIDLMTQMRVMAHEFGHVLGFPDCYTEFYDREKKSLIYYEISKDNTNIMCSMKSGVSVPADYLQQLAQKSCLFN